MNKLLAIGCLALAVVALIGTGAVVMASTSTAVSAPAFVAAGVAGPVDASGTTAMFCPEDVRPCG
ncbi:MAG: hypothetical protein OXR66_05665 [Candidatus Woesearchaeota archaeon]|nr:hypothetical protein [Candidatus Woesearchaeota archaeon]